MNFLVAMMMISSAPTQALPQSSSTTGTCDPVKALEEITAIERKFAARTKEVGRRQGFSEYGRADAVIFAPSAKPISSAFPIQDPPGVTLDWWPAFNVVSADCTLAFSLGPWVFGDSRTEDRRYGYYATIWQKEKNDWRFVIDGAGSGIRKAPTRSKGSDVVHAPVGQPRTGADYRKELSAVDDSLNAAALKGLSTAIRANMLTDTWLLGSQQEPLLTPEYIEADLSSRPTVKEVRQEDVRIANSGDLGYSFGQMVSSEGARWNYMRVWQWRADKGWKLLFDGMKKWPVRT